MENSMFSLTRYASGWKIAYLDVIISLRDPSNSPKNYTYTDPFRIHIAVMIITPVKNVITIMCWLYYYNLLYFSRPSLTTFALTACMKEKFWKPSMHRYRIFQYSIRCC